MMRLGSCSGAALVAVDGFGGNVKIGCDGAVDLDLDLALEKDSWLTERWWPSNDPSSYRHGSQQHCAPARRPVEDP
jgi:hypothetical protein